VHRFTSESFEKWEKTKEFTDIRLLRLKHLRGKVRPKAAAAQSHRGHQVTEDA